MPHVERELLRVASEPGEETLGADHARVKGGGRRLSGGLLAVAVSAVALLIGAGFLVALHASDARRGNPAAAPTTPVPPAGHGTFPGAPRPSRGHFTSRGLYVCRRSAPSRYLPRRAGCVSVLRADMTGGGRDDLVLLYATLGAHRVGADFVPSGFTLEVVRPGGAISRTRVAADPLPWITRVGNVNGVPGDELVLHLDDISSGDTYGIYTMHRGRVRLVRPLLSAGGDSAAKEGFVCGGSPPRHEVISAEMVLLGPTIHGRWRWTLTIDDWHGATLRRASRRTFVSRGLPTRRDTTAGAGCGRPTGATQANP